MSTSRSLLKRCWRDWPLVLVDSTSTARSGAVVTRHAFSRSSVRTARCSRSIAILPRSTRARNASSMSRDSRSSRRNSPNSTAGETAADLLNTAPESELERIFREYGEEPLSRRAARVVVSERDRVAFARTGQLAALIEKVLPRRGRIHPATRVFQALRIAVNDELGALRRALETIPALLRGGARFAVITFHSLEDRIVKSFFRAGSEEWHDRPEWPAPRRNPDRCFLDLTRKPLEADTEEVKRNPRARSARLRAVEMICLPQEVAA